MNHQHEERLSNAYLALAKGDVSGYWSMCASDFVYRVPGRNQIAGIYRGWADFVRLITRVLDLTDHTFHEEIRQVLANDRVAVVFAIDRFCREGRPQTYRTAHVYRLHGGRLITRWEQPVDLAAFNHAWA